MVTLLLSAYKGIEAVGKVNVMGQDDSILTLIIVCDEKKYTFNPAKTG